MTKLLAPNGKPSKLTPEQYKLVRSPEFKAWFGDWENSPETSSKVVDSNGEPLPVYHGSDMDFNVFEKSKTNPYADKQGYFFAFNKKYAESYNSKYVKQYFLNLRTRGSWDDDDNLVPINADGVINDGLMIEIYDNKNIKLADGTNTKFDGNNPDIRFEVGGGVDNWKKIIEINHAGDYSEELKSYVFKNAKIYYSKIDREWLLEINHKIVKGFRTLTIAKRQAEMMLLDTYKNGGDTKNKIMEKQMHIQFDETYAKGGVTFSQFIKDDYFQQQFKDWMEDGNVSKRADGTYSTQDAQYRNSLKGIGELKKYFYNEFIKGQYADGGKAVKKYVVVGEVYDGGEVWKETFDNLEEAIDLAREIENGWTDDGTYYLITIYNETGKKVTEISDDKYFNELTENKLFKKFDLSADTKKTRQIENEKLNGYKFKLEVRIANGEATKIYEKTFDSIFDVMDKMNTYYEEDYYALINGKGLDYWEEEYSEINASRNFIKGKYGWYFIKEGNLWIAKDDYDNNHIVRLVNGKITSDSSISKGALKQIMELEAQKKYSEKPKHNNSLSDMKKIWDKLSENYKEREDIAFLVGYYGGLLSDIVPKKWDDIDKATQIDIMNAYFGQTEEQKQKIINEYRKRHEALVKEHKTLRNLYGLDKKGFKLFGVKIFEQGGATDDKHLIAKAIEYITGSAIERDSIQFEANKIAFRYKGQKTFTDISQKLIENTISMHRKSLEGRYADGGEVQYETKRIVNEAKNQKKNTHFAIHKPTNSIVFTWDFSGYDTKEMNENKDDYFYYDVKDIVSGNVDKYVKSDYAIVQRKDLEKRGIDLNNYLVFLGQKYDRLESNSNTDSGEAGFNDEGTSMVLYHEKNGNFLIPKGQVYLYLYDVEDSKGKLQSEQYDWVFYPYASQNMAWASDFIPPLKKIWTKKFQKEHKGSEHLLGVIKAYLIDKENGKKELYIDMMSVNPTKMKKGIMSYMIKELRDTFKLEQDQVTFSKLTPEGEKFVAKKTYADGGWILMDGDTERKIGEYETESEARKMMYEYEGNSVIVEKSKWNKYADGGNIEEIKTKYQIAGSDKSGVYTYSKRIADEIAKMYSGNVEEDGSKWYVRFKETYADGGAIDYYELQDLKNQESILVRNRLAYIDSDSQWAWYEIIKIDTELEDVRKKISKIESSKYANGGDIPHEDKMYQLPLEMVVYVPSTQDVDKVISVDEMVKRVNEVKEYLGSKFGGYSSTDKLGGFVDSKGNLINEDVTQVTSFATKEAFEENKEELIQQLAKWGKKWGQEAIGFEFEGDLLYVPQEL
jgi:hypothetical protein